MVRFIMSLWGGALAKILSAFAHFRHQGQYWIISFPVNFPELTQSLFSARNLHISMIVGVVFTEINII